MSPRLIRLVMMLSYVYCVHSFMVRDSRNDLLDTLHRILYQLEEVTQFTETSPWEEDIFSNEDEELDYDFGNDIHCIS